MKPVPVSKVLLSRNYEIGFFSLIINFAISFQDTNLD